MVFNPNAVAAAAPAPPVDPRTVIQAVLKKSAATSDTFHREARAFRNRLLIMTMIAVVAATCLVLLQLQMPDAHLLQQPPGTDALDPWAVLLLVMVFGAIGALLSAVPAMAAIPQGTSPFNFPMQQGFLKISVGSLTAIVGVVVTGSAGVTNGYANLESLVGASIVFGAAQQAVTQFLDKRAGQILALPH